MASVITHAITALGIGVAFRSRPMPGRFWVIGVACAVLPDLDVVGFALGIRYDDLLGHRGLTHSLFFAAAVAAAAMPLLYRDALPGLSRPAAYLYLFLVTASHGLLDALTNGGLGVAFFAPFDRSRYFFPWHPIEVSPIGVGSFFGRRGLEILASEAKWVWLPMGLLAGGAQLIRRNNR